MQEAVTLLREALVDTWDMSQYPRHTTLEQLHFRNDLDKLRESGRDQQE